MMSFPINDIPRRLSPSQQINDLWCHHPHHTRHSHTCRVRLHLHYVQPAQRHRFWLRFSISTLAWVLFLQFPCVECGLGFHMISMSCRVRLSSKFSITTCHMLYSCPNLDPFTSLADLNYNAYFLCRAQTPTSLLSAMLSQWWDMSYMASSRASTINSGAQMPLAQSSYIGSFLWNSEHVCL